MMKRPFNKSSEKKKFLLAFLPQKKNYFLLCDYAWWKQKEKNYLCVEKTLFMRDEKIILCVLIKQNAVKYSAGYYENTTRIEETNEAFSFSFSIFIAIVTATFLPTLGFSKGFQSSSPFSLSLLIPSLG